MLYQRLISPLLPRSQPWITRQSYAHELVNALTYPTAIAMVEGGVVGVLAKKAFDVPPLLFAMIMAAPMFANLTSFVWAYVARGRSKVRVINVLQVAVLVCVASIAALPTTMAGAYMLTGLVVLARCILVGVVTLRSTVWRMNYPRHIRAQVTGRLVLINTIILAIAPLLGYALVDYRPEAFRFIYPASLLVGLIGVVAFSKVRLRGERDLLRYERSLGARPQPHGIPAPIYEYDPKSTPATHHAPNPQSPTPNAQPTRPNFWQVLKQDHFFRAYMFWQFFAGSANMCGEVVIIYVIADATDGLPLEYMLSILLAMAMPMAIATIALPYWARQLDTMHVAAFRARQGRFWIANQAGNFIGAMLVATLTGSIWVPLLILFGARLIQGVVRGAGMLAWNLGHNDFADRRMVATYMGIHVTLTGIRGAVAPFLGMALYAGWRELSIPGTPIVLLPAFAGVGYWVFLVTTLMAAMSEVGFRTLYRAIRATGSPAVPAD
ncbi:MAG: MFS transporter [Phycisphaeraceae bacterium]